MKKVVILGSTGTIGLNTLEVIRQGIEKFRVIGLACQASRDILAFQIDEFHPSYVCTEEQDTAFESAYTGTKFLYGEQGLEEMAVLKEADIIVFAIPGIKTLKALISAIKAKKTIGLATKEVLVVAGDIIMPLADREKAGILPIDSEHNAIFQALEGLPRQDVAKVYLTASGGPFYGTRIREDVSPEDVLAHPVWKMGKKITVDSATMMNKAFEVIEAHHLFNLPADKIDVLIHPEALVHGMAELTDGTIKGIFSVPDMKFPISFVLNYPDRNNSCWDRIDFGHTGPLHFVPVKKDALWFSLARQAIEKKGSFPVVLNGANEEAVDLFLAKRIRFMEILPLVQKVVESHNYKKDISLDDIVYFHNWAKHKTTELIGDSK